MAAIDVVRFSRIDDRTAMEKAASEGLQSMEHLIRVLSTQTASHQTNLDCREITDLTVGKFKQFISVLNRTGHARFRRGPPANQTSSPNPVQLKPKTTLSFESANPNPKSKLPNNKTISNSKDCSLSLSPPLSTTSSFLSSVTTGDASVSNGKVFSSAAVVPPAPVFSSGKPPLSQSHRKRCHDELASKTTSGRCHCSKRRKTKVKRTIRVPAISTKIADIPSDEFSWRKYGQKSIKGSPYPRGYYRCSSVRGCPARKKVERALDDPTILVVTYEAEHRHPLVFQSA